MTKLLSQVLREVDELPEERQNDVAHVIRTMLNSEDELSDAQLEELDDRIAQADAGKFASAQETNEVLHRSWA